MIYTVQVVQTILFEVEAHDEDEACDFVSENEGAEWAEYGRTSNMVIEVVNTKEDDLPKWA